MLAAAASSSTSSSSSSSASSSSPSPPSPLDAVSPDQALAHPTLAALDPAALDRTTRYLDEVLRANGEGLNLTAVRGRGPALLRHCADSLDLLPFIDREEERWLLLLRQQLKEEEEEEVGEEEEEEVGAEEDSRGGGGPRHRRRLFTVPLCSSSIFLLLSFFQLRHRLSLALLLAPRLHLLLLPPVRDEILEHGSDTVGRRRCCCRHRSLDSSSSSPGAAGVELRVPLVLRLPLASA